MTAGYQHLVALASRPRGHGTEHEAMARRYCADVLQRNGFSVSEEPFAFSAFVGKWATPVAGALASAALVAAAVAGRAGARPGDIFAGLVALAVSIAGVARWVARYGVLEMPIDRETGVNLSAVRGSEAPTLWLVAHIDSKSQPIPILLRALGLVLLSLAYGAVLGALLAELWGGPSGEQWWPWVALAGSVSGIPVAASMVANASPGAADNASGVATVLRAAELLPAGVPLGILISGAEELGLAGSRAWATGRRPAMAVNIDTVDDAGPITLTRRYSSRTLARHVAESAGREQQVRIRRVLPGILTDGVALADEGWDVVTLSRGTLATLARIHTTGDTVGRMRGEGIEEAARILVAFATRRQ